jgi:uncharacterized protein YjeT (DUF2065 family)
MMIWTDLFAALALYLVLEGIMPFLSPVSLRRAMAVFVSMTDRQLRIGGLISMLVGVALLYFIRGR